jgi:hypothetical protein
MEEISVTALPAITSREVTSDSSGSSLGSFLLDIGDFNSCFSDEEEMLYLFKKYPKKKPHVQSTTKA